MKEIPLLKATDIEARVQRIFTTGANPSAMLLLYKSARTDMRILDEVYGPMNWKRSHEVIDGALFCTISIWDDEKKEWISKQDVGVPSNRDAKKGEASDAFKRAGFNWGIGRELYDAPTIFVNLNRNEVNGNQLKASVVFTVADAEYDKATHAFTRLVIVDRNGQVRWELGQKTPKAASKPPGNDAQQLAEGIWNELKARGVDPDEFALFSCKTSFREMPFNKLQSLAANFDASVDWFKKKAV